MDDTNILEIFFDDVINNNCGHYIRGCRYVSPCCGKIYNCRLCHDAEMYDNMMDINKQHKMKNPDVKKVICKKCYFFQDFAQYCESCDYCFGKYYCEKCKFIDDNKDQEYFHCDKCGICRRGKGDEYEHCDECNGCFRIGHKNSSLCQQNKMNNDCPICFEELFHSIDTAHQLTCKHMMHSKCFDSYLKSGNPKCPICRKTIVKNKYQDAMLNFFSERLPVPEEYANKMVDILCQDCEKKSNVKWHYIAMFCPECGSHNVAEF